MKTPNLLRLLAASLCLAVAACTFPGVYKIPIQQGNTLETDKVDQLELGQTMSQVKFLLGTPMITDSLSPGRWDYLYNLKQGDKIYKDVHMVVYFGDDGKVEKIDKIRSKIYGGGKTPSEIKEWEEEQEVLKAKIAEKKANPEGTETDGAEASDVVKKQKAKRRKIPNKKS